MVDISKGAKVLPDRFGVGAVPDPVRILLSSRRRDAVRNMKHRVPPHYIVDTTTFFHDFLESRPVLYLNMIFS